MSTATATFAPTPIEVIDATLSVIAARGYWQPTSRQWEAPVPTAFDVRAYLQGYSYTGEPAVFRAIALASYALDEPGAILTWARDGADSADDYRRNLARVAAADQVTEQDIPLLCSAVPAWRRAQHRAAVAAEQDADRRLSTHQGVPDGDPITRRVTVAVVIDQGAHRNGSTRSYLIKLRDADHNIYIWPATSRTRHLPAQGDRIEVTATVHRHTTYRDGTAQTYLRKVQWTPIATA
ncbi:hypothetical protein ACIQU6_30740 [Streptomyces sp. NPDC090442]|uniref:hypothetical protein n=1 Tax=Streptomyces sp. NPDC090442 TaxID=3365962 RepID=UPI003821E797